MDDNNKNPNKRPPDDKKPKGNIWVALIVSLIIVFLAMSLYNFIRNSQYQETTFSDFLTAMEEDNLAEVELQYDRIIYMTKEAAALPQAGFSRRTPLLSRVNPIPSSQRNRYFSSGTVSLTTTLAIRGSEASRSKLRQPFPRLSRKPP